METFRSVLTSKKRILFDGATGTELYNRGLYINKCFEEANLLSKSLLQGIYQDYLNAGAQILTTNSWGASRNKLRGFNLENQFYEINRMAAQIAKESADGKAWVAGSIGPLGMPIEPLGPTSYAEAQKQFGDQVEILYEGGADFILLETFGNLSELEQAILAARIVRPDGVLIASLTVDEHKAMPMGTELSTAVRKLDKLPVDVIGLNCSVGPQPMMDCLDTIIQHTSKPLCFRPNAGMPKEVDGRKIYLSTPDYMATFAKDFLQSGVQFVGGCCGTTPEHIRMMSSAMRHAQSMQTHFSVIESVGGESKDKEEAERAPFKEKSFWSQKIAEGKKACCVELLPPNSIDPSLIIKKSARLIEKGVDAINIPDGPRASARMSALLTCVMIEKSLDCETILHYTCRDRNLLGMQSDLMGASAIGLKNLLLVTGDPPKLGPFPSTTGVFDIDAIGLTNMVHKLNGGYDLGDRAFGKPCAFSVGVGVNPGHRDFQYEMDRFKWKVDAGAEWAITQPVFDVAALEKFYDFMASENINIPIVAGIWPLVSFKNAVFLHNEVPGISIPEPVMKKMELAKTREEALSCGVGVAREMIQCVYDRSAGFQVSAPFGKVDVALDVLKDVIV